MTSKCVQILFMDVTDAFQCPFQDGPLDLDFADCFYVNRKVAIEGRLRELTMMTPPDIVKAIRIAYLTHYKKVCNNGLSVK